MGDNEKQLCQPGLTPFLTVMNSKHPSKSIQIDSPEVVSAPLDLLRVLIDRQEIKNTVLVQSLHPAIISYAYKFDPVLNIFHNRIFFVCVQKLPKNNTFVSIFSPQNKKK